MMMAASPAITKMACEMGKRITQQFSKRKIAPSYTDFEPKAILLRRHTTISAIRTPPAMKPLPIMIRLLKESLERLSVTN
jgi:hypothetical protein